MEDYYIYIAIGVAVIIIGIIILIQVGKLKSRIIHQHTKMQEYVNTIQSLEFKIENQQLKLQKEEAEYKMTAAKWAQETFEKFKETELIEIKKRIESATIENAATLLHQWKIDTEAKIRQDAVSRSYAVNMGKITEHLIPFHTKFIFNPKDARFIGSPIDLIVFDGLSEGRDDIIIYFVEIKSAKTKLSERQEKIKKAVERREIIWYQINSTEL